MKITKEVKAALVVLTAIVLLIFGYNFLKGNNLLSDDRIFYANYESVDGLNMASIVTVNGLKVGKVLDIDFADEKGNLQVKFVVDNDFAFGKNSVAKIYSAGFIGGKNLAIVPELKPNSFAESGQTLKSSIDIGVMDVVSNRLDPIQQKLNSVLQKTDLMLASLNDILTEENTKNISSSLSSLSASLNSLKYTSGSLQSLIAKNEVNLSETMSNFNQASNNAKILTSKLSQAPIDQTMNELNKTVKSFSAIADKLNSNRGTVGKLLNDDEVYDNLDRATRQLDLLLQDMKLNPKRYVHFSVFEKKDKGYEQPADSLK